MTLFLFVLKWLILVIILLHFQESSNALAIPLASFHQPLEVTSSLTLASLHLDFLDTSSTLD